MSKVLKRLDLFLREVVDPYAQENFYRLRNLINDIEDTGIPGPQGPPGPAGPAGPPPSTVSRLLVTFTTDAGTAVGNLVYLNGVNTVTKTTDNASGTIPHGVFGVGYSKPSPTQIDVLFSGIMGGYAGFTSGSPLFISTGGIPTHTVPTTGMVQQLGFAVSSNEFFIQLMQPMRRA